MEEEKILPDPDLTSAHPRYTWEVEAGRAPELPLPSSAPPGIPSESLEERVRELEMEVARLTGALKDVVALALAEAEPKQRAITMQRRAIVALSGLDMAPVEKPEIVVHRRSGT